MEADSALTTPPEIITCRICWAEEGTEPTLGTLISPCLCSGSIKWVHTSCLNSWCLSQRRESSRAAATRCEMCRELYQIPDDVRQAFDDEIWEGFIPGPRTVWKRLLHMVTQLERDVGARTPLEWILECPLQAIMLGGFVRGMQTSYPFARQCGTLAVIGFQTGAGALALKLPHMLLLAAILPHRLRVSLLVSAGTYMMVLGLQVPLCAIMGANIGWCFGYAVGCAETATAMRAIAANIARPVLGFVQALANFGLRRLHGDPTRRRLR